MNKKIFSLITLIVTLLILLIYIFSLKSINGNDDARAKTLIEKAFPQYNIIKQFDTGIHLQGFILENKEKTQDKTVTFTSDDGSVIVNGELLAWDSSSNKLTSLNKIYTKYFTSDDNASELYLSIKKDGVYIQQSSDSAPHKFYAIIDPSCSYCHSLFIASQQAIKSGDLAVRWIVVGALNNSRDIANSIYNSDNRLDALVNYETTKEYNQDLTKDNDAVGSNDTIRNYIKSFPTIVYKNSQDYIKTSGGSKLPLTNAKIAEKENIIKVNEFLILTSDKF